MFSYKKYFSLAHPMIFDFFKCGEMKAERVRNKSRTFWLVVVDDLLTAWKVDILNGEILNDGKPKK